MADQPLSIVNSEPLSVVQAQPLGSERTRVDTNAVGVDHDKIVHGIADWASKLPPAWQKPAAMLATFPADALASLLEMFSAPETIAGAGFKPANAAVDTAGTAVKNTSAATARSVGAAVDAVDPDLVSIASPRVGAALKKAQQVRDVLAKRAGAAAESAVADEAPAVAEEAPAVQPGPRTINDAMAEAVKQAQAAREAAKTTSRGASASAAPAPPSARGTQSPPSPTPPTTPPPVPAGAKPSVTAAMMTQYRALRALGLRDPEMPAYLNLVQQGKSEAEALSAIQAMRQLSGNLPTAAEAQTAIRNRNATGKWSK